MIIIIIPTNWKDLVCWPEPNIIISLLFNAYNNNNNNNYSYNNYNKNSNIEVFL
jgi:hypothetical protein